MIEKLKHYFHLDGLIFLLFTFLLFFKANGVLNGNEVSGIFYSLFYRLGWQYLPSIFLYGHEPARGLVELPFIFLGPNEFILRLPSLLMALVTFWVVRKTIELLIEKTLVINLALLIYVFSGVVILSRLTNGAAGFFLFICLSSFYFLRFLKKSPQQKNFDTRFSDLTKSLFFLFISLLFYIDSFFVLLGMGLILFWKYKKKIFKKQIIRPFFVFFVFFSLYLAIWTVIPYLAAEYGYINKADLKEFGFFRVLNRGGKGLDLNILKSFAVLNMYNSPIFNLVLLFLFFWGFRDKWGRKYNFIFLFPLVYFSLHSSPTVHFLHFLPLIIIGASLALKKLFTFNRSVAFLLVLFLVLNNAYFLKQFYFPKKNDYLLGSKGYFLNSSLFKAAGFVIRESSSCDQQIFSNLDSFITLFYTGLPDKKNLEVSSYALLFNDQLDKTSFSHYYRLKDNKGNIVNIYSDQKLVVPSLNTEFLAKEFTRKYHYSKDLFPNIKCQNYR